MEVGKTYEHKDTKARLKILAIGSSRIFYSWRNSTTEDIMSIKTFQQYYTEYKEPRKGKVFVNVYRNGMTLIHGDRNQANNNASKDRIACIEVDWVEGQGL